MRNGSLYRLPNSVRRTRGKGSSLLPTLTASEHTPSRVTTNVFRTKTGSYRRKFKDQSSNLEGHGPCPIPQSQFAYTIGNGAYQASDWKHEQNGFENFNGLGRQDNRWNAQPFFVTDDWSERIQRFREETLQRKQGFSRFQDVGSIEELFNKSSIPQPLIRRGSNGLPRRLGSYLQKERTQAIGNAVVPQVAQFIARRIKELTR